MKNILKYGFHNAERRSLTSNLLEYKFSTIKRTFEIGEPSGKVIAIGGSAIDYQFKAIGGRKF